MTHASGPLPKLPPELARFTSTDDAVRQEFSTSRGPIRQLPLGVSRPPDVAAVAALCAWASQHRVALIARGAGTGMPGGNTGPGVIVDLSGLSHPRGCSAADSCERLSAGAGVVAADLDAHARSRGRWLPALPSSAPWCTLGGMVANDAAGARSFRWGPVHAWLDEATWVRADGSIEHLTRTAHEPDATWVEPLLSQVAELPPGPDVRKNSSGYALDRLRASRRGVDLVPGSEGTLGLIVEVVVRSEPRPEQIGVGLVGLPTFEALPTIAHEARVAGASACEYFGRRLIELGQLAHDPRLAHLDLAQGLALVEFAGPADEVHEGLRHLQHVAASLGRSLTTTDETEAAELWQLRHAASPMIARAAAEGLRSLQFIEDGAVPVASVGRYAAEIERILTRHETDGVIFGHLGDGHLHVNPLLDLRRGDALDRARAILDEAVALIAELGGTLAGEHGDGRLRAPLLGRVWPSEAIQAFREVKDLFDPTGVLNPGVIVPLPGQDPLEGFAHTAHEAP